MVIKLVSDNELARESVERKFQSFLNDQNTSFNSLLVKNDICHSITDLNFQDNLIFSLHPGQKYNWNSLISTDNSTFNKTLISISQFCYELDNLTQLVYTKYVPAITMYFKTTEANPSIESFVIENISNFMPTLLEMCDFLDFSTKLLKSITFSLENLYTENSQLNSDNCEYKTLLNFLGNFVLSLSILESTLLKSSSLQEHLVIYKRIIAVVKKDIHKYKIDIERLDMYEKAIFSVEKCLFSKLLFHVLYSILSNQDSSLSMSTNSMSRIANVLLSRMNYIISELLSTNNRTIMHPYSCVESFETVLGLLIYFSLALRCFDSKILNKILKVSQKIPIVLPTNLMAVNVTTLLKLYIPNYKDIIDSKLERLVDQTLLGYLNIENNSPNFIKINELFNQANKWCIFIERTSTPSFPVSIKIIAKSQNIYDQDKAPKDLRNVNITQKMELILNGLSIIKTLVYYYRLFSYLTLSKNHNKTTLFSKTFNQIIFYLTSVKKYFLRNSRKITATIFHDRIILNHLLSEKLKKITEDREKNSRDYKYSFDTLNVFQIAENLLAGPLTYQKVIILLSCLEIVRNGRKYNDPGFENLCKLFKKWTIFINLYGFIDAAADLSNLYLNDNLVKSLLIYVSLYPSSVPLLGALTQFADDSVSLIKTALHINSDEKENLIVSLKEQIFGNIFDNIIKPGCLLIETDLRFLIFNDVSTTDDLSKKKITLIDNLLRFSPFRIHNEFISLKAMVSQYFERMFYNLTAISPFEWRNYESMRRLACLKYDIHILKSYLPIQQLEQGLDLLEIISDLEYFSSNYSYNLNNQVFIERSSQSNHLKVIHIRHVANSIRIHGVGVANSAVNMIYQLLKQKFFLLSNFLFSEQIKSRLLKEKSFYNQYKKSDDQFFPFERVESLIREIKSINSQNSNIMTVEQVRDVVCQIGNMLGLVRMLKNGIIRYLNGNLEHIPEMCHEETPKISISTSHSETSIISSEIFCQIFNDIQNFSNKGIRFFEILVKVFLKHFQAPENSHLKNFYILVPALILSSIEHIIRKIESMNKKHKDDKGFTEDGTLLGIAFILRLLDQYDLFDHLQWFVSLQNKMKEQKDSIVPQLSKNDERLQNTLQLSLSRLKHFEEKISQAEYSLFCTKLFFKYYQTETESPDLSSSQKPPETANVDSS